MYKIMSCFVWAGLTLLVTKNVDTSVISFFLSIIAGNLVDILDEVKKIKGFER